MRMLPLRAVTAATLTAAAVLTGAVASAPARATGPGEGSSRAWPYWKADLHAHSVVSGDGTDDPGIIADAAKGYGFNAVFLTDHQAASYSPIGAIIASHVSFEDDSGVYRDWNDTPKAPTATATAGLSTEHVLSGTNSYRSSVTGPGEAFGWIKRGPNLHSGQITLRFSVFPTQVDPGGGLYVSASLGGDPTVTGKDSEGYTTGDGTVLPGHSTTFVWQLGSPRVASDDGTTRVLTQPLAYTLNTWNTYTIDVTAAVDAAFPDPATRPGDLNALLFVKMAAGSRTGGTETGFFDSLSMDAANASKSTAASSAAADFVARNQIIHNWDTPTFMLNPGQEMGFYSHSQRLHFPITDVSQWQQFTRGYEGIPTVQASGFPAQLNHPGLPGGVTDDEAISNGAYGADLMEAVERGTNDIMIRDWDALLSTGEPLVGTWTSDSHRNSAFGPATIIQSPSLDELSLQHSLFEGRVFLAQVGFPGTVSFAPDDGGGSYPARYPVYRSPSDSNATVTLSVSDGLAVGQKVVWLQNGAVVRSDDVTGPSYRGSLTVTLPDASTPVRAEVRAADGHRVLMTEPVMLRTAAGLPHGLTAHLERVSTPSGTGYTKSVVQGITALAFDSSAGRLTSTLQDPAGSTVEQLVGTGSYLPQGVTIDGTALPQVTSRSALEAGSSDGWAFDSSTHQLAVRATHGGATGALVVSLVVGADTTAPSVPEVTAVAENAKQVTLRWPASTDDTAVTQYTVRRGSTVVATLPGTATGYDDTTVVPDTSYSYSVTAQDLAQNVSAAGTATVRTQQVVTSTVLATADTYASSASPSTSYGTAKTVKADASPETNGYLRFLLPAGSGKVLSAQATLTATGNLSSGIQLRALSDHTWGERTLTFSNAPALGSVVGTSPKISGGTPFSTDVTAYAAAVPPGGSLDLGLTDPSSTAVSLNSREANAGVPTLTVQRSAVAPQAGDLSLTTPEDVPLAFTPSVSGGNGPLTCSIDNPPASGTAWVAADCSQGQIAPGTDKDGTDSFTYVVTDGTQSATGRVTYTTTPVNDAPRTDQEVLGAGTDEDTPVTLTLAGNDIEGQCPLAFAVTQLPQHGTLGALGTPTCANGTASATVTYTPDRDFDGNDSLTFTVADPSGATSAPAALGIAVAPVDDPPTASPVSLTASAGVSTAWTPVVSDVDSTGLVCALGTAPSKGAATVAADCSTGTYAPDASASGADAFSYTVKDATSTRSATVSVSINGSTQPPTAAGGSIDTAQRAQVTIPLSGTDPDGGCPLSFAVVTAPAHGSLTALAPPTCSAGSATSSVDYAPADGYAGSDSLSYRVTDSQGQTSPVATVSITVTPPVFVDGFESGTLSAWTRTAGVAVRTTTPRTGTYDLDVDASSGGPAYAKRTLGGTLTTTETSTGVQLLAAPSSGSTALVRLRAGDDTSLVTVSVDSSRRLKLRNEVANKATTSTTTLPLGSWALLTVRVTTSGTSSTMAVLLNGVAVPGLSFTSDLGTYRVGALQLGDNIKGPTGHALFDDVRVTGS